MKEIDIDKIIDKNHELLLILGIATGVMIDFYQEIQNEHGGITEQLECKYQWILKAIENVVYNNKPLPKFPG